MMGNDEILEDEFDDESQPPASPMTAAESADFRAKCLAIVLPEIERKMEIAGREAVAIALLVASPIRRKPSRFKRIVSRIKHWVKWVFSFRR